MIKTTHFIDKNPIRVPDSPDPIITTIGVTEKEINLIKAMREIESQDDVYKVQITTTQYPGGYMTYKYHDTFKTKNQIDVDESMKVRELSFPEALANIYTFESYIIINGPDNTPEIKKPKYYKCRNCGKIIDDKEYHRNAESGMCFCEYSPELRILNPFFLIKGDD